MSDSKILEWIASHMTSFELGVHIAVLKYIDDDGFSDQSVSYTYPSNMSDVEVMRECVTIATMKSK